MIVQSSECRCRWGFLLVAVALFLLPSGARAGSTDWSTAGLSFLLPSWAASGTLFQELRTRPEGVALVELSSRQCLFVPMEECGRRLTAWRQMRGNHPLVTAALNRQAAVRAQESGDTALASNLSRQLGYLLRWSYTAGASTALALADPVSGEVDVHHWYRPTAGATVELESVVFAPDAMTAAIRLTGAWLAEVCVNQTCTELEEFHSDFWDAHAVQVSFKPGENRVRVRFLPEAQTFAFVARVTRPSGREQPADYSSVGMLLRKAGNESRAERMLVPGAIDAVDKSKSKRVGVLPCVLRRLAKAPETAPAEWVGEASFNTVSDWDVGLACAQGTEVYASMLSRASKVKGLQEALVLHAMAHSLAVNELYGALVQAMNWKRGRGAVVFAPRDPVWFNQTWLLTAEALRRNGLDLAIWPLFEGISLGEQAVPSLVTAWVAARVAEGDAGPSFGAMERLLEKVPGQPAVVLPVAQGNHRQLTSAGLGALKRLTLLWPTDSTLRLALFHALVRIGRGEQASTLLSEALEMFPNHPELLRERALEQVSAGEFEAAKQTAGVLLALHGGDIWARELVARLGGEPQDDPFKGMSEAAIRKMAEALPEVAGVRYAGVTDKTFLRLHGNGGTTLWRLQVLLAVQPEEGTPLVLSYQVDNEGQYGSLQRGLVLHGDGTSTAFPQLSEPLLQDSGANLFYDVSQNYVEYPDLLPGDLVVFEYRVDSAPSVLKTPFSEIVGVSDSIPKWNTRVEFAAPKGTELAVDVFSPDGRIRYKQSFFDRGDESIQAFEFPSLARVPSERFAPGWFETGTWIHVAQEESAQAFGAWYSGILERAATSDRRMRELVEDIRKEAEGTKEVTEALCRYVAEQIRYVGLELGVHRLKPHAPSDVLRHRFGDCKDKSLLLVALLRLAGVSAHVVAVSSADRGIASTAVVSPALFNHAIVYLDDLDLYFDPTAQYLGLGSLPWQVQGAPAVIIAGEKSRLVTLPGPNRGASELDAEFHLQAPDAETGTVAVTGTLRFVGENARRVLPMLLDEGQWATELAKYLSGLFPVTEVAAWEHSIEEGTLPVLTVRFEGVWKPLSTGGGPILQSAAGAVSTVLEQKRQLPAVLAYPYRLAYRVSYPAGAFDAPRVPAMSQKSEDALIELSTWEEQDVRGIRVVFEQLVHRVPLERIPAWRRMVQEFRDALASLELRRRAEN